MDITHKRMHKRIASEALSVRMHHGMEEPVSKAQAIESKKMIGRDASSVERER